MFISLAVVSLALRSSYSSSFAISVLSAVFFFFFNDTATTEIYTLSLHDALPICDVDEIGPDDGLGGAAVRRRRGGRSEEHTSELQSLRHLVCRLLLEKKKQTRLKHRMDHTRRETLAHSRSLVNAAEREQRRSTIR